jgi:Co/Zn/Cd efflux system component
MVISPRDVDEAIQHGMNENLITTQDDGLSVTDRGIYVLKSGRMDIVHQGYWIKRFLTEKNALIASASILVFLVIIKLFVGLSIGSQAMTTDGLENLTDLIVVGIIGYSLKHNKDRLGATAIMVFMLISGSLLGYNAVVALLARPTVETSFWGYVVALLSIGLNYGLIWYKTTVGRMTGNLSLLSDAKEDGSHIKIGAGVLIGFIFAEFGLHIVDSLVALMISFLILMEGIETLRELQAAGDELNVDTIHLTASDTYDDIITSWLLSRLARRPRTIEELKGDFLRGVEIGHRYFDIHAIIGFKDLTGESIEKHFLTARKSRLVNSDKGILQITNRGLRLYYKNRAKELQTVSQRFSRSYSQTTGFFWAWFALGVTVLIILYGPMVYEWIVSWLPEISIP